MSALHRLWRLLPRTLRREALFGTTALLAPRPDRPAPDGQGSLTVAGFLSAPTGLGAGARLLLWGLREAGLNPGEADLTGPLRQGPGGPPLQLAAGPGTLLMHVNGPMLPWALLALGRSAVRGKRVIAVWNWELPVLPRDWDRGFSFCHAIWVGSSFVARACARPGGPPLTVVPYPVPPPEPSLLGRDAFGLPEQAFVALCVFDATSSIARKNPLGAIEAHRRAFGSRPDRLLVLKTHGTALAGAAWRQVAAAAAALPNVRVMDGVLPRGDLWALMAACDVVVSLHRAEGFGLSIGEAMRLGLPVVATDWSGNTDFMRGPGTDAVPFTLIPTCDPQEIYADPRAVWAEPDLDAAAAALARLAAAGRERRPPPRTLPLPDYAALLGPVREALSRHGVKP